MGPHLEDNGVITVRKVGNKQRFRKVKYIRFSAENRRQVKLISISNKDYAKRRFDKNAFSPVKEKKT